MFGGQASHKQQGVCFRQDAPTIVRLAAVKPRRFHHPNGLCQVLARIGRLPLAVSVHLYFLPHLASLIVELQSTVRLGVWRFFDR